MCARVDDESFLVKAHWPPSIYPVSDNRVIAAFFSFDSTDTSRDILDTFERSTERFECNLLEKLSRVPMISPPPCNHPCLPRERLFSKHDFRFFPLRPCANFYNTVQFHFSLHSFSKTSIQLNHSRFFDSN